MTTPQALPPVWRPEDLGKPTPEGPFNEIYRPDILEAIETRIADLDGELRNLSVDIHGERSCGIPSPPI